MRGVFPMRLFLVAALAVILVTGVSGGAGADVLVLSDTLMGSTSGTRSGGVLQADGWRVTGASNYIFWHLPYAVQDGKVEFDIKGIYPNECRVPLNDKTDLFHMYDWTYGNADYDYDGYRNNPYKHFIRKIGCDGGSTDAFELVFKILDPYTEPDTSVLSWSFGTTYHIMETWGPDGSGNCVMRTYRNGALLKTMTIPGTWNPAGHSVRIGIAHPSYGAPIDAVYSNVKVWQAGGSAPGTPSVTSPANGATVNTRLVYVKWTGDSHESYQVRVNTANDPSSGIAWDSGEVTSARDWAWTGTLSDLTNYYVFVRIGNSSGWSNWSAAGRWFRVDTGFAPGQNLVKVLGNSMADNDGPFLGLGFTYMQGLRRCKYDRTRYRSDLAFMSSNGYKYQRVLTMVGWYTYWDGYEIAPITFYNEASKYVAAWPDYWQQFRDMIDIAYDEYGIRSEVTIFADAQLMPNSSDRYTHMDNVLANLVGREHKVMHLEVANEYWQNGFPDPGGVTTVRAFGQYLADRTSIPVALSDGELAEMYQGSAADIATEHFSRDIGTSEGGWLPVRDCWDAGLIPGIPPMSSNEPIGPGASVNVENDPIKLVSAAVFAWTAGLPLYVYHTDAGVKGLTTFQSRAGVSDYRYLAGILPPDLPSWVRNDGKEAIAPFTVYCSGQANKYWTDIGGATSGCHRNIGAIKGGEFMTYCQGVLGGGVTLEARQPVAFKVYNPMTGQVVLDTSKNTGEQFQLPQGPGAYIITGILGTYSYGDEVWLNMGSPEVGTGLTLVPNGDGDTTVVDMGGRSCRKNANQSEDFYHYFGVADGFAYQGSTPELWVTVAYFDTGSGSLTLQYDSASSPYENTSGVALTNSNTWKKHTYHVTNAYFGNRQNAGADFRIAAPVGLTFYLDLVRVTKFDPASQAAYPGPAVSLPGVVQAENYDTGGEGYAYHDTDAVNDGAQYRTDGVDVEAVTDTGGGYNVGWINAGEWLEYSVNVATPGNYDIKMRVASDTAGGTFHIEMDGINVTGSKSFPATGGWQSWTTVTVPMIALGGGPQTMRVVVEAGGWNFNYIDIATSSGIIPPCFADEFTYTNGNLNGRGGWTGSATNQIAVENSTVKVLGGATLYNAIQTISCSGSGGVAGVWVKAKKGVGDYTMWNLYIDDPSGNNLGRWYGKATSARGRIGGGGQVATSMELTGGWDDLYVRIDFAANSSQFFFNGVSTGTLYHSETGAGDSIGRIRIERENNSNATGNYMWLDDVAVGVPDTTAPTATIGAPSAPITKNGPVSFAVNFSETVYGFDSASDIQLNSTGGANAGSVVVLGSGTAYTVMLSSISGSGTLGISVKAAAANDVAGIPNTVSAASATFKVVGVDGRISDIKDDANGSPVVLGGKALFLKQSTFGYIEETDRTAGIRVEGALGGSVGDLICLSGVMATKTGGERYVNVDAMAACGVGSVDPFGLNNRALIDDFVCGLRVKAWGKVKPGSITANSYVLTDGSDTAGIKVITAGAPGVSENQFVTVIGAAGLDGVRVLYRE